MDLRYVTWVLRLALALAITLGLTACAPALSPARMPPTSDARSRPAPARVVVPPAPDVASPAPTEPAISAPLIVPESPIAIEASPMPGAPTIADAPAAPTLGAADAFPPSPAEAARPEGAAGAGPGAGLDAIAPRGFRIALVLPLESPTFAAAAQAVAAGFSAAANRAPTTVVKVPHGDGEVVAAFEKARAAGATVIVGPLVRDDLKTIAGAGIALPWTIALNQLEDGSKLPDPVYTLALSIEGEGRQIAQQMQRDGVREVAIVANDTGLQRRFAASFVSEWLLLGGGAPKTFRLSRNVEALVVLRGELARVRPDAILLAADAIEAAAAKPFLGQAPVYVSSQVNERQPREAVYDLDGTRFVEVPWLTDAREAFPELPPRDWPDESFDRLYALGFDAYRVALAFIDGAPRRLELDGATGRLSLLPDHRIAREGRFMQFQGGRAVPLGGQ